MCPNWYFYSKNYVIVLVHLPSIFPTQQLHKLFIKELTDCCIRATTAGNKSYAESSHLFFHFGTAYNNRHKTYDNRAATVSYHQVHKHGAYLNPILKKLVINSPLKSGILNSKLLHAKVSNNSLFILTTCCSYFIHKPKLLIENWSGGPIWTRRPKAYNNMPS